ncbi:MAG: type II toxin-antitoxin system HicA family toxin [Marinomonas sp.]
MKSREVIQMLIQDGWYEVRTKGSHVQFKHPSKKGTVTVPHLKADIPVGTFRNIQKQAQLP